MTVSGANLLPQKVEMVITGNSCSAKRMQTQKIAEHKNNRQRGCQAKSFCNVLQFICGLLKMQNVAGEHFLLPTPTLPLPATHMIPEKPWSLSQKGYPFPPVSHQFSNSFSYPVSQLYFLCYILIKKASKARRTSIAYALQKRDLQVSRTAFTWLSTQFHQTTTNLQLPAPRTVGSKGFIFYKQMILLFFLFPEEGERLSLTLNTRGRRALFQWNSFEKSSPTPPFSHPVVLVKKDPTKNPTYWDLCSSYR